MAQMSHNSPRRRTSGQEAPMTMIDTNRETNTDRDANIDRESNKEDRMTRTIEHRTSKVPSVTFLGLAVGSMVASAALMLSERKQLANFVGQWAPTILIIGVYNKLVKVERELMERRGGRAR
jgi:hypothetical protein